MSSELGQDCKELHEIDDMQVSVKMFVLSKDDKIVGYEEMISLVSLADNLLKF